MPRIRAAAIVIKDSHILLMHRINKGEEYYSFPGGGKEEGESIEEAVVRELDEETTVKVRPTKLAYRVEWDNKNVNYLYVAEYISGTPGLRPDSEEQLYMNEHNDQLYEPLWVPLDQVSDLTLYPLEVRDMLIEDIKNGFKEETKTLSLMFLERRQK